MAVVNNHCFVFIILHNCTNICFKATDSVHIAVVLTAATDGLFDSEGWCGSYVAPDVALLWSDGDGGEWRAPRLEIFRGGVAHKLQVLHLSRQILLWT